MPAPGAAPAHSQRLPLNTWPQWSPTRFLFNLLLSIVSGLRNGEAPLPRFRHYHLAKYVASSDWRSRQFLRYHCTGAAFASLLRQPSLCYLQLLARRRRRQAAGPMPRVDIWDVQKQKEVDLNLGFSRTLWQQYDATGQQLGRGGFGSVQVVRSFQSGKEFACKSITKKLAAAGQAAAVAEKQLQHLDNIRREIRVLRKLRGTLNVVAVKDVYEDDSEVHIVMELCRGGELLSVAGKKRYTENLVGGRRPGSLHLGDGLLAGCC